MHEPSDTLFQFDKNLINFQQVGLLKNELQMHLKLQQLDKNILKFL